MLEAALERPRHVVLAAVVAGLLLGPLAPAAVLAALVAALLVGGALRRPALAVATAAALVAGGLGAEARLGAWQHPPLRPVLGRSVEGDAVLVEPVRARAFGWSAAARPENGPARGLRVALRGSRGVPAPAVGVGAEVRLRGRLVALARWEAAQRVRGARLALAVEAVRPTGRVREGPAGVVDAARRRAERALAAGLPPAQAALARGMVLGQDEALDDRTRADFRASGLSHLLAASGQNVTLLALLATAGLALLGVGLRGRLAGALALVAAYVPLAGAGPSIERAGVMGAAGLVAALAGRPGSRAYALLLAAAATIALNPRAPADVGWQLSFAAVVAIALLAPRWRDRLVGRRVPRPLAEGFALTTAATVGTAPLLALHFDQVSVVSPIANLVAAPAVAPVVWLGTLAGLAGQAGAGGPIVAGLHAPAPVPPGVRGWGAHVAAAVPPPPVAGPPARP